MGYRSDVLIAIAFSSVEHRDEVWAVYCIDPRVQKHNLSEVWNRHDDGPYPVLWYSEEYTKWYDSYDDVSGVEHLMDLMSEFAQEKGLPYAYVFYRVGEETTDIEIGMKEPSRSSARPTSVRMTSDRSAIARASGSASRRSTTTATHCSGRGVSMALATMASGE
jgi:hypothetical protein